MEAAPEIVEFLLFDLRQFIRVGGKSNLNGLRFVGIDYNLWRI